MLNVIDRITEATKSISGRNSASQAGGDTPENRNKTPSVILSKEAMLKQLNVAIRPSMVPSVLKFLNLSLLPAFKCTKKFVCLHDDLKRLVDVISGNEIVANVRIDKLFVLRKPAKEGSAEATGEPLSVFTIEYKAEEDR